MTRKDDAEVVREVAACIDAAIAANRRQEWTVVGVLLALFGTGLGLLVYGAASQTWAMLASGGLAQFAIAFPVYRLIRLREDNMRLRILPQLMRLAESAEAKALAAQLVRKLIEKV